MQQHDVIVGAKATHLRANIPTAITLHVPITVNLQVECMKCTTYLSSLVDNTALCFHKWNLILHIFM